MSLKLPDHLRTIKPYMPGKPIEELQRELGLDEIIKLASNESPLGPPQASLDAIEKSLHELNRYPEDSQFGLKSKISEKFGVPRENITVGAGSAEIILNIARCILGRDDFTVISEKTFIMYWLAVQSVNGNMIRVPLNEYTYDMRGMLEAIDNRVRLVYIANPNNPTGTYITADELETFMDAVPENVVVVYDEAYRDYVERPDYPDPMKYFRRGDNIVILRTFSKIYGLAGMRIGYCIANDFLSNSLARVRVPFNLNTPAAVAAIAALDSDDHVKEVRAANTAGMSYLSSELAGLGLDPVPSVANFIFVDYKNEVDKIFDGLLRRGVIIRPTEAFGIRTGLRISIGLPEENEKLLTALKAII